MSAAGEGGLRTAIATRAGGSALRRAGVSLLERRGRRTWQCPRSAEGDVRALNDGAGFGPEAVITRTEILQRSRSPAPPRCAILSGRKHGRHRAVNRRDFITLFG